MHRAKKYVAEFNRPRGDSIAACAGNLTQRGPSVTRLPHLTTILIERPSDLAWSDFKAAVRSSLQPRRGSVVVASCSTGRVFVCSNRGNRPGRFQLVAQP